MGPDEMRAIAGCIDEVLRAPESAAAIRPRVETIALRFA
jgi:glycine/serine hydroxymethyltransferase